MSLGIVLADDSLIVREGVRGMLDSQPDLAVGEPGQLARAVRAVAAGGSVVDPAVVEALVAARATRRASPLTALTDRERDVLAQIAQGKSNAAAGAALFLSERAVEKHINTLFAKLGLTAEPDTNRRVKAVLIYLFARACQVRRLVLIHHGPGRTDTDLDALAAQVAVAEEAGDLLINLGREGDVIPCGQPAPASAAR
ncbi:helix-turn-helix transcriptional regulator [Pseudofrankia sp. DC12]|uniref:response regulator transcription factor n=1 Tax=Pseudofrankia sp. DC12 TaxID=683315 RepID=UPI000AD7E0C6|nr:helix-turn-helix transcriptional regulator [Pseudofrankia sp. DC12]